MKRLSLFLILLVIPCSFLAAGTEAVVKDTATTGANAHKIKNPIINFGTGNTVDFTGATVDFTGATVTGLGAGSGTVTSFTFTDGNGFDGTVANSTTTPTLSLSLDNNAVSLAKMADMATASFLGRNTAATGDPEVLSISTVKTMLNLTGTNSGDQDLSGYQTLAGVLALGGFSSISGPLPIANIPTGTTGSTVALGNHTHTGVYEVPLTFSTGLTRSTNTVTVNTTQNIAKLTNLTSNGLVSTSGGDGTLGIVTDGSTNWNTAYTDRLKWDGGATGLTAATGRTSLGGTTVGQNIFTLTDPSAITFLRLNADNTVTARTAAQFVTDLGMAIGEDVQEWSPVLDGWSQITPTIEIETFLVTPTAANFNALISDGDFVINGTNPSAVTIAASGTNQPITLTPSGTGQVFVPAGTVSLPGISSSVDADTGIVFSGSNVIDLSGAGSSRHRFSASVHTMSSGVVAGWSSSSSATGTVDTTLSRNAAGIIQFGTTAANALGSWLATNGTLSGTLSVTGASTLTGGVVTPSIDGGAAADGDITIRGTSNATRTTSSVNLQPNGGTVGIGTTAPNSTTILDIQQGIANTAVQHVNTSAAAITNFVTFDHRLTTSDASIRTAFEIQSSFNNVTTGSRNSLVSFYTATAGTFGPAMTLNGGTVGIGTTTPLSKLSINGGLHVGGDSDAGDNNAIIDGTLSVTGATTLTGGIVGKTDASNATAGNVGEVISSTIVSGSAVSLSNSAPADITSISLTAGDWDVWFESVYVTATTTSVLAMLSCISETSATLDQAAGNFAQNVFPSTVLGAGKTTLTAGPSRKNLSGTTTIYAVGYSDFGVSTMQVWGILRARRVR